MIRLSAENEPQIYTATHRFGTILENVVYDPPLAADRPRRRRAHREHPGFLPARLHPQRRHEGYVRSHPKNVIFLTCDASGVLPPIARLDPEQAMYHFISGYTSKIAGTEIGLGIEPQITFSACFGAPFMVHHPFEYAKLLTEKMAKHDCKCWLVNTGWIGRPLRRRQADQHPPHPQPAERRPRRSLDKVEYRKDKLFGFDVPLTCPDVPEDVLEPANAWGNKDEYWKNYDALAARYIENFKLFTDGCPPEVVAAGPKRLSQL